MSDVDDTRDDDLSFVDDSIDGPMAEEDYRTRTTMIMLQLEESLRFISIKYNRKLLPVFLQTHIKCY